MTEKAWHPDTNQCLIGINLLVTGQLRLRIQLLQKRQFFLLFLLLCILLDFAELRIRFSIALPFNCLPDVIHVGRMLVFHLACSIWLLRV